MNLKKIMLLAIAMIVLIACGKEVKNKDTKEKEIILGYFKDIGDLNPHLYSGEMFAQNLIFEGLVSIGQNGEFKPSLAESWKISEDGKTYVFNLRKDVKFNDGEKFNAEVAKLNFEAILTNINRHKWLQSVTLMDNVIKSGGKAIEATREYELTIRLSAPYYPFLVELGVTRPFRFISPKAFINGTTKEGVSALSGTGPYMLSETKKDQYSIFVENPNYWGNKPSIKKVVVKVIPENQTRVMALEKGEIDMIFGSGMLDAESFNNFKNSKEFETKLSEPSSTRLLLLNTTDKILKDKNLRKAIQHIVDKKTIGKFILSDTESPADFVLAENVPHAKVGLKPYEYNMVEAEKILDEAGWIKSPNKKIREKNGEKLKIQISYNTNNPTDRSISEFLQGEFLKVGIELDLLGEEDQTYKDRLRAGKFQMAGYVSWGNPYEPHSFLGAMTSPIIYGDYAAQQGVPDKKEIDKSILKALESTSEEERQNNYKFVLERLHDEAVYIPISYERNRVVYSKKVKKVSFDVSKYNIPIYDFDVE